MKFVKNKSRVLLSDEHLSDEHFSHGILRVANSSVGADIDCLANKDSARP